VALAPRLALLLTTLLPGGALVLSAQSAGVAGTVLDAGTRLPLAGVVVEVASQGRRAETDSTGTFRMLGLSPQIVVVRLRSVGYQPVERSLNLFAGRIMSVEYLLSPAAVALPDVTVSGRDMSPTALMLEGFEDRRRLGIGKYYTQDDIARHLQRRVPDLLRDAPSVSIRRGPSNEYYAVNSRRTVTSIARGVRSPRPCFLDVYIDGNVAWSADRGGPPIDLAHFVPLSDLVGVEVYSGIATVPAEFRRHASNCGAIIFWTRRGGAVRDPRRDHGVGR
jgi:hypothetical protein